MDLNCDVGEVDDDLDAALLALVTSAHVACGFHAGGPTKMRRTVEAALAAGVAVGAHPSYDDREGFGRRALSIPAPRVADEVAYQLGALMAVAARAGTRVRSVKAHGALYHRLAGDDEAALAVGEVLSSFDADLVMVLPAGAPSRRALEAAGVLTVAEGFCDRRYLADGSLVERAAGGVVEDPAEAARRAVTLATGAPLEAVDGAALRLACDTVCLHGDGRNALAVAAAVRGALDAAGVRLAPFAALR